jgi:hypothetical protein
MCGEDCLAEYCKECRMKLDAQVDMLEFKEYAEINLDETPVVALACGHFFTAETLDGTYISLEISLMPYRNSQYMGLVFMMLTTIFFNIQNLYCINADMTFRT